MRRDTGHYLLVGSGSEAHRAFVPAPLPPAPALNLTPADYALLSTADRELGRLDGMAASLPEASLFIYFYIRKEAVLSSQIEGTQSSLSELLLFEDAELPGALLDDVTEVSNYVDALNHGRQRLAALPLSLRLIRELHERLMASGRGANKDRGRFRRIQNWIGGRTPATATFVPPPPQELAGCLHELERFILTEDDLPLLVKAALLHVQFETIHPFLDGNGRVGRLLILLFLHAQGVLHEPLLYLSLFFKRHRSEYYTRLNAVRAEGDWEGWLRFFLQGVVETARSGISTARRLQALAAEHLELIRTSGASYSVLQVHAALQRHPNANTRTLVERTGLSKPTVLRALESLIGLGLVVETSGRNRRRIYAYAQYLALLTEGTEPL